MAQKALQLDESLTEAHTARAYVKFRYEWNCQLRKGNIGEQLN